MYCGEGRRAVQNHFRVTSLLKNPEGKSAVQWNSSDDQAYQPKQEEPSDEVSRLSARTHWRGDVKCAMSENAVGEPRKL
ncbi:hypothetical protein T265_07659 [Opisthorchis viverrini]|uniref:Uncharacterized protein n=1 Tax=Opisthorchis viverrini TaxID=6198 RepID=A0A074ZN59_OPIVI|nr:hypothetical protein T265_07659 [Opisthorchis viverrini]KER24775.1 hypothetical protein T265_07659 [Opisthorchis viverrini]